MAGHMGDARTTVQNLEVVSTDGEKGLIFIKGRGFLVRRMVGCFLETRTGGHFRRNAPHPAGLVGGGEEEVPADDDVATETATAEPQDGGAVEIDAAATDEAAEVSQASPSDYGDQGEPAKDQPE